MRTDGLPDEDPQRPDITHDAVVVIPGIMGSELLDRHGHLVWGLSPTAFARAWARRNGLESLALTDRERDLLADGRYTPSTARLHPGRLLRVPTASAVLGGCEPYTNLVREIHNVVADPAAVLEFAYDWRLPVAFNSHLLADAIDAHLTQWRAHPAHKAAREEALADRPAQVVLVAHSMGGLLARGLCLIDGATDDVRMTITLGTPFYGSVKAAVLLNSGHGAPFPRSRLRDVAVTMPGVYDLLPTSRCLLTARSTPSAPSPGGEPAEHLVEDVVRLTSGDVAALGGDRDLAEAALAHHERVEGTALTGHRPMIGTHQPTWQSMTITDGVVHPDVRSYRWTADQVQRDGLGQLLWTDYQGDGTVHRYAATPLGVDGFTLPQTHGALAKSTEAIRSICAAITDQGELGIRLGAGDLGLDVPDVVPAGTEIEIVVTGEMDPAMVTCTVRDTDPDSDWGARPRLAARRGSLPALAACQRLPEVGLYRVAVKTGGSEPVTQIVIATPPFDDPAAG
jgi:pimeloyl-ACP methyl ester carboxylesterase